MKEMLLLALKFLKSKTVLIAAFLLLALGVGFYTGRKTAPINTQVITTQMLQPVTISRNRITGKEDAKVQEVVISKEQMKVETVPLKKELKAKEIQSITNIVTHSSLTLRNDTISIKRYDTRKWFLAPLTHQVDITHSDTSVHSTMASSLSYKAPRVLFTFGPYLGYDPFSNKPSVGVAVVFNVISIKSKR